MAQLSQGLINEFRAAMHLGGPAPYTANEFEQLLFAWEELQRVRRSVLAGLHVYPQAVLAPYQVIEPLDWPPIDLGPVEGTK